jgi:hypothetical protein
MSSCQVGEWLLGRSDESASLATESCQSAAIIVTTMRTLPHAKNLRRAVECVIESNTNDGYSPTRFRQVTMDGAAPNLLD